MPAQQAFESIGNGIVFANWPIMWIVVNAMFIYNTTVQSGIFEYFRRWILTYTPPDKRIEIIIRICSLIRCCWIWYARCYLLIFNGIVRVKRVELKFYFQKKTNIFIK
jgi:hypothetical protein